MLHYKYVPRNTDCIKFDVAYAVMTPAAGGNSRIVEAWTGQGSVTWHRARWEDLPTQYSIVNTFANFELKRFIWAV